MVRDAYTQLVLQLQVCVFTYKCHVNQTTVGALGFAITNVSFVQYLFHFCLGDPQVTLL